MPLTSTMTEEEGPPYISAAAVARLVSCSEIVEAVKKALVQYSAREKGGVVQPVRTCVDVSDHEGVLLSMPAYSQQSDSLTVKLVTVYPRNAAKGLSSHQGIILVFDAPTGAVEALIEVEYLTSLRTAAASVCAIQALAPGSPPVLCVVGTGAEARSHLQVCRELHGYQEVRLWGRDRSKAERCAKDVGGEVKVYERLEEAVRGADVIVTVTLASEPVLFGKWLKPGAVVCCVGACRPDTRELDDELMQNAVVTVDTRDGASQESGDIISSKAEIYAEVGEIISGTKPLPKVPECGKKYYLFKSQGMAVEDALSAKLVYDRYKKDKAKL